MSLAHKALAAAFALILAFTGGFVQGQNYGREATLKAAVAAYQTRERITHDVQNMDADALCMALGGVPNECTALMRGLDKAAQN